MQSILALDKQRNNAQHSELQKQPQENDRKTIALKELNTDKKKLFKIRANNAKCTQYLKQALSNVDKRQNHHYTYLVDKVNTVPMDLCVRIQNQK